MPCMDFLIDSPKTEIIPKSCHCHAGQLYATHEKRKEKDMIVKGKYVRDCNFTTIFSGNAMYTVARKTGDWSSVAVGDTTATGHVLDQETYDRLRSECESEGEFELS